MNKHYLAETQREIVDWPGTTITQENAGKHGRIILHYKGESRIVVVSNTPSDARAIKNHIATVRRELRGLGASKTVVQSSPHQRDRNTPIRIALPVQSAPVPTNPFENLERPVMSSSNIDVIFSSIEKLRYSEMLEFASILSSAACQEKLRRSHVQDWARTMQAAATGNRVGASA